MTAPLWINAAFNGEPEYDANALRQAHALPFIYDGRVNQSSGGTLAIAQTSRTPNVSVWRIGGYVEP